MAKELTPYEWWTKVFKQLAKDRSLKKAKKLTLKNLSDSLNAEALKAIALKQGLDLNQYPNIVII